MAMASARAEVIRVMPNLTNMNTLYHWFYGWSHLIQHLWLTVFRLYVYQISKLRG
jgi:hypothetical protein